ncbi:MAG TPA: LPS export ABC transporter periplasmic protein LptC [bacterium]|nr:LPS export ABC transporter periplasmic protein LptC [bacterium]
MKKEEPITIPPEPMMELSEEEATQARRRRVFWLLAILVLVVMALYWGLSKSKPNPNSIEFMSQGENSPDAVIEKFHLVSTIQGQKRWTLDADTARFFQNQKQAYADQIYAQFFKQEKITSTLTADKAIINTETNATQAEGHVELIVDNGSKLETDKLNWEPETDTIKSDSKVHIYKGMDDISATGLIADTELNNVRFLRDVHTRVRDPKEIVDFDKKKRF